MRLVDQERREFRLAAIDTPADAAQPVAQYSPAATLIASVALVGSVLAMVVGVFHVWRSRRQQESRLAIYLERDDEIPNPKT